MVEEAGVEQLKTQGEIQIRTPKEIGSVVDKTQEALNALQTRKNKLDADLAPTPEEAQKSRRLEDVMQNLELQKSVLYWVSGVTDTPPLKPNDYLNEQWEEKINLKYLRTKR